MKPKGRKEQMKIAEERIRHLFAEAEKAAFEGKPELANQYVSSARRISVRNSIPIPKKLKRKYCRHCYAFFTGDSSKVRINSKEKRVEISCLACGKKNFYPYVREVKQRRKTGNEG